MEKAPMLATIPGRIAPDLAVKSLMIVSDDRCSMSGPFCDGPMMAVAGWTEATPQFKRHRYDRTRQQASAPPLCGWDGVT